MNQLLIVDSLDLHVHTICFATALVLTYSKSLTTLRGSLVDNVKFTRWVLFKEVAEYKFSLSFTV